MKHTSTSRTPLSPDLSAAFPVAALEEPGTTRDVGLDPVLPAHLFLADEEDPASAPARSSRDHANRESRGSGLGLSDIPPAYSQGFDDSARSAKGGMKAVRRDERLPEVGTILDKYRLEELLGVGGFSAVYRATHLMLEMPVAVKLLRPRVLKRDPRLVDALCEEARFAARIHHPNVVRVYDVTRTTDVSYVVMELIEGDTLARVIARAGALDLRAVAKIGIDVVDGLAAALKQGLIHRDIKPANVMITKTASAKVVDLSLARASTIDSESDRGIDAGPGYILGTPMCMAPEQAVDPDRVDFRADIYSLGATLYHAATGVPPFSSRNAAECVRMHREEPVPLPSTVRPNFPRNLQNVLLRMLAKSPSDRFPSYESLRAALTAVLAELMHEKTKTG